MDKEQGDRSDLVYSIGDRIRQLRYEQEITARELGELVGVHEATIVKYEIGKVNFPIMTLERIANGLGVTVNDLIKNPKDTKRTK